MQPKQYIVMKWCVYGVATLLLCLLQICVLRFIRLGGVTPFLYPMLAAVVAVCEGRSGGVWFALTLGAACDLGGHSPFVGFFIFIFTGTALLSALLAEYLLEPGFLCGLAATGIAFGLTDLGRLLYFVSRGQAAGAVLRVAVLEFLVTLPLLLVVVPAYRWIRGRVSESY